MEKPSFHFITLFPETVEVWFTSGILGKAHQKGLFSFECLQLRDFAHNKHRSVDDVSYGGGGGMVLSIEPLVAAIESIRNTYPERNFRIVCPSPSGKPLTHTLVLSTVKTSHHLIFVCGRYEGIDQRFLDHFVDLEFSLGDFVMTAGEIPAIAFADALVRQISGTLGNPQGPIVESFSLKSEGEPLLEYPQYTRPSEFRGLRVPQELLTGDHKAIQKWRLEKAKEKTLRVRPDMLTSSNR